MDPLKQRFYEKSSALTAEMKSLLKEHGALKIDEVKLSQAFGGARGIKMMIWETSQLDAYEGIRFRGILCVAAATDLGCGGLCRRTGTVQTIGCCAGKNLIGLSVKLLGRKTSLRRPDLLGQDSGCRADDQQRYEIESLCLRGNRHCGCSL